MIELIVRHNLTSKDIGHQHRSTYKAIGYVKRGGMKVQARKSNPLGRHPFNIITKEVLGD